MSCYQITFIFFLSNYGLSREISANGLEKSIPKIKFEFTVKLFTIFIKCKNYFKLN